MHLLSQLIKSLPVGITYAIFAGICIIGTTLVRIIKFNQIPGITTVIGLTLIISVALIVNLFSSDQI